RRTRRGWAGEGAFRAACRRVIGDARPGECRVQAQRRPNPPRGVRAYRPAVAPESAGKRRGRVFELFVAAEEADKEIRRKLAADAGGDIELLAVESTIAVIVVAVPTRAVHVRPQRPLARSDWGRRRLGHSAAPPLPHPPAP